MSEKLLIYHVDDDEDDLSFFEEAAVAMNIEVRSFDKPAQFLEDVLGAVTKPSMVFVDLNMPGMSGYEVIEKIRHEISEMPIVVLTTAADHFTINNCKKIGANYFIKKPTSVTKLGDALRHTVGIDWNDLDNDFVYNL